MLLSDLFQLVEGEGMSYEDGILFVSLNVENDLKESGEEVIEGTLVGTELQLSHKAMSIILIMLL